MSENRLVKVALPSKLVSEMDQYVTKSAAYPGRTEFVTDAVANLLADLRVSADTAEAQQVVGAASFEVTSEATRERVSRSEPAQHASHSSRSISTEEALELATVSGPSSPTPKLALDAGSHQVKSDPTWGMHNRDWPTIWAGSMLGRLSTGGPIGYDRFKKELLEAAWSIVTVLRSDWDLSGFPSNGEKAARSEARFIEFFVGSELGNGPLFSFGIAAPKGSTEVLLTNRGAELLDQLSGITTEKGQTPSSVWRLSFLRHLAEFAPADVEMLREVVTHISSGEATRLELISAIGKNHPDWPGGTSATNAAGYVARAREWGLIARRQVNHQYVIESDAMVDLDAATGPELGGEVL